MDWVDELTDKQIVKEAGIFNPVVVSGLMTKGKKTRGLRMSNTDNMRIVAVLSTMLTYHLFIENNKSSSQQPAQPQKIIDKLL